MTDANGAVVVSFAGLERALPSTESNDEIVAALPDEVDAARVRAALAHAQLVLRDSQDGHSDVLVSPSDPLTARFQSFVAERAREDGSVQALHAGGQEARYDGHDLLGWLLRFPLEWLGGRRRRPFLPPAEVEVMPKHARLALFSDWGTGLYGAPHIQNSIEHDPESFEYAIHLGDVYYAGTLHEFDASFLPFWPRRSGTVGRALNGNHEMYTGGRGYFVRGLPSLGQPSSVFALRNDHWLIVGLDTAYTDFDLAKGQLEWLDRLIEDAGARKLILLSHHQLYSNTGGDQGARLQQRLDDRLTRQRIFAWYWGHEHVAAVYDQHPKWGLFGHCIGHGGIPEFRHNVEGLDVVTRVGDCTWLRHPGPSENPSCLFLDGPNPDIPGHAEKYLPHGYATLTLDGPHLLEELRDAHGAVIHSQQLA